MRKDAWSAQLAGADAESTSRTATYEHEVGSMRFL